MAAGFLAGERDDDLLASLNKSLAGQRFRAKLVIETERGEVVIYRYAEGFMSWGDTVEFKATLEFTEASYI